MTENLFVTWAAPEFLEIRIRNASTLTKVKFEEEEVMFRRHKISFVQKWPIFMINVYAQKIIQQFEIPAACSCFIRSFKLSGGDLSSFWTNKN